MKTKVGTTQYMAPELHASGEKEYDGEMVDIFALGTILYVISTGTFPFESSKSSDNYYRYL